MLIKKKKKNDKEKQREKVLEISWISIGYAPLGLFALKDEHVLVYVNKPFYHQTAMPVSSTANSVLWQKQKQTNKKRNISIDAWERTEKIRLHKVYLCYFFLRASSFSHLSHCFLFRWPEKLRCSVGLGMVIPGKVDLDLFFNFCPLGYREPAFPCWLGSVLRRACVLCCIGPLLSCLRTYLRRWARWSLCTAGIGYVRC